MIYPNLSAYYVALGGESSRETIFGQASLDAVADPRGGFPLEVRYNHGNGDVLAIAVDGRVVNLGTVIGDDYADTEEILSWFHEPDGSWPERSLQELRARVDVVNGRYDFKCSCGVFPWRGRKRFVPTAAGKRTVSTLALLFARIVFAGERAARRVRPADSGGGTAWPRRSRFAQQNLRRPAQGLRLGERRIRASSPSSHAGNPPSSDSRSSGMGSAASMIAARANWVTVVPWASAASFTFSNASAVKERLICNLGMVPPVTSY